MKKTRKSTEQIIRILRDSEGLTVEEACRKHEISAATYHRWKAKYGGMGVKEAQRLRDLEKENGELKKLVQRVRREEGLQVPPPKPTARRQGLSTGLPQEATHRNHVWAWDFVSDYTQRGGKLQIFNLIDEHTKECHSIHADRAIKATDVLQVLQEAIALHGAPEYIRSRNGPEFIARAIQRWLADNDIKTIYIDSGCPWQNCYIESFNDKFRPECLNRELIFTLSESRVICADYQHLHNYERPHRSLGLLTPKQYAKQLAAGTGSGRATPSFRQSLHPTAEPQQRRTHQPLGILSQQVD